MSVSASGAALTNSRSRPTQEDRDAAMIGHGPTTFLDAPAVYEIAVYVQQGIERMRERHGITDTPADVLPFLKIAEDMSMSGHALRTSEVIESESPQSSDLPMEVTVSQAVAEGLVPWCEVHTRRKIRAGPD
jgi:hypothetical protein